MNNHDSTDMRDRDSMKMEGHDSMKMHDHKAMEMKQGMEKEKGTEKALYYTCSMESHKHVRSSEPGKCPECGMNLVKVVEVDEREADFFGCPIPGHQHIRSDEPGKCPEDGMLLLPMKLKKS